MKSYLIKENPHFIGRRSEQRRLDELLSSKAAQLIAIYGRRRVGKTEFIEQYFRHHTVLKFEGIEVLQKDGRSAKEQSALQIAQCFKRLGHYTENPLYEHLAPQGWTAFFERLRDVTDQNKNKDLVLYFEEVQWLANYRSDFFAEMKPFWDDVWRHYPALTVVLCGSSTSFLMNQLLADKALYGRVTEQIHLKPFNLIEAAEFLKGHGAKEVMTAQLSIGGICGYLDRLKGKGTVFGNLCKQSFLPSSYFLHENEKIFVSHLSHNKHYEKILKFLSQKKFASLQEISKTVRGNPKSGGSLIQVLDELQDCGFIERYTPLNKQETSKLVRYAPCDEYLQWYYKFIHPKQKDIEAGKFSSNPTLAVNRRSFEITMGLGFERWCRKFSHVFARIMEFAGVDYEAGAYFDKKNLPGFQIDLIYVIKGSKIVVCEIKYAEEKVSNSIYAEVRKKLDLFQKSQPRFAHYTFETVLITPEGLKDGNASMSFDRVITFKEIFERRYWE